MWEGDKMPMPRIYNIASMAAAGGSTEEVLSGTFSFGDISPKKVFTVPTNCRIITCQVIIDIPFDDVAATLTVGKLGDMSKYMAANQNIASESGEYQNDPYEFTSGAVDIYVTINKGASIQGQGIVLLEIDTL
jgi:hypothetical protein